MSSSQDKNHYYLKIILQTMKSKPDEQKKE